MRNLQQEISNAVATGVAPTGVQELHRVQETCKQVNGGRESACDKVQTTTGDICDGCRFQFQKNFGRAPLNVTLPAPLIERLMADREAPRHRV